MNQSDDMTRDVNEIAAAANRLGVELDATQVREWILTCGTQSDSFNHFEI